jgi:hypothetical protein
MIIAAPFGLTRAVVGGGDSVWDDVVFYFNCNSKTNNQSPTIGSGTVSIGQTNTVVTGQVGNALRTNGGTWRDSKIGIPAANFDLAVGTIGFWINRIGTNEHYILASDNVNWDNHFFWALYYHNTDGFKAWYRGASITTTLAAEWVFVEFAWSQSTTSLALRINNGSWSTSASASGTMPTYDTELGFSIGTTGQDNIIDQILISNVYQADLYSIRNETGP